MRANFLRLRNFRSYAEADIPLRELITAAVIGPNGGGKSSIAEAIDYALFGPGSLKQEKLVRRGQDEMSVLFEWSMGDQDWRVVRAFSTRGGGTTVCDLARFEVGEWVGECSGAAAVTARILEILGTDRETWRMSAFAGQRKSAEWFDAKPARRHEKFGGMLKLDVKYDPVESHFKAKAAADERELTLARRDVERLESEVKDMEGTEFERIEVQAALADWSTQVESGKRTLESSEQAAADAAKRAEAGRASIVRRDAAAKARRERTERISSARAAVNACQTFDELNQAESTALALRGQIPILEARAAELLELKEQDAERSKVRAVKTGEANQQLATVNRLKADLTRLHEERAAQEAARRMAEVKIQGIESAETPTCQTCGQAIAGAAREKALAALRETMTDAERKRDDAERLITTAEPQLEEAKATRERLQREVDLLPPDEFKRSDMDAVDGQLVVARQAGARLSGIYAAREKRMDLEDALSRAAAEDPDAEAEWEQLEWDARGAEDLETAHLGALEQAGFDRRRLEDLKAKVASLERDMARIDEALKFLGARRQELGAARKRASDRQRSFEKYSMLAADFGKWGLRSMIVLNVLGQLEREINDVLALYDCGLAVRFEGAREIAKGQRDSLEIMVRDPNGFWDIYETYSGGEEYRIESAMRLGLSSLLAHRSGARIETLIMDEPEGLDVAGQRRLAEILKGMHSFGLILLLTHYEDLKESMPQQILVSRGEDGTSVVEVAA